MRRVSSITITPTSKRVSGPPLVVSGSLSCDIDFVVHDGMIYVGERRLDLDSIEEYGWVSFTSYHSHHDRPSFDSRWNILGAFNLTSVAVEVRFYTSAVWQQVVDDRRANAVDADNSNFFREIRGDLDFVANSQHNVEEDNQRLDDIMSLGDVMDAPLKWGVHDAPRAPLGGMTAAEMARLEAEAHAENDRLDNEREILLEEAVENLNKVAAEHDLSDRLLQSAISLQLQVLFQSVHEIKLRNLLTDLDRRISNPTLTRILHQAVEETLVQRTRHLSREAKRID
jgi:hypothetical protein